jgi:acyl-CoA synthetase (AMP-forming)/AMP-acid ligase II
MYNSYVDVITHQCEKYGEKDLYIFLADGEDTIESITYIDLLKRVKTVAARLMQQTKPGERILLLCPPGIDYNLLFISCLFAGVIPVPLYPPDTRSFDRVVNIINDCSANAAIANSVTIEKLLANSTHNNESIYSRLNSIKLFDSVEIQSGDPLIYSQFRAKKEDIAFLQYTSGSTNRPKGVMVTHENLISNTHFISNHFQHTDKECIVSWIPPFHDMGLIKDLLTTIYSGNTLVYMSPYSFLRKPIRWLNAITKYSYIGPVSSGAPNFGYDLCIKSVCPSQIQELNLSNWRVAYNGAEPVRVHTLDAFHDKFKACGFKYKAFEPVYGLAEATLMVGGPILGEQPIIKNLDKNELNQNRVKFTDVADTNSQKIAGCGRIIKEQETIIVNPDTLLKCNTNEIGEIWVKGPSVAAGYYNNETETQKAFNAVLSDTGAGPYLRTGDLGFLLDDIIYITGRIKDLIIINGQNHYPHDLELTACLTHKSLRENAGIAFSVTVDNSEKLVIVYEIKRSVIEVIEPDEIRNKIKEAIFQFHSIRVHEVVLVDPSSIPKTSSGKLQRSLCRKMYLESNLKEIKLMAQPVE